MSLGFQTLMPMIPYKLIISVIPHIHLRHPCRRRFVLTVVAVFIINSVIVSFLILFFYWFYLRPTKDCKIELYRHVFCIFIIIFIFFLAWFVLQKKKIVWERQEFFLRDKERERVKRLIYVHMIVFLYFCYISKIHNGKG